MSRTLLRAAWTLVAVLAAALPVEAGEAEALVRFRRAVENGATADERAKAARGAANQDSRAVADLVCRAISISQEAIAGFSSRRSEVREEQARIRAEGEARGAPTKESAERLPSLRIEEEALRLRDDEEQDVLAILRRMLGRFRDRAAVEYLCSLASRSSTAPDLRREIIAAFGAIGGEGPVKAVRAALRDRDPAVREAAFRALVPARRGGEGVLQELASGLADPVWTVRLAALKAIAGIGTPEAVDLLVPELGKETGRMRADIADLLRGLTGQRFGSEPEGWAHWWAENRVHFVSGEMSLTPGVPGPPRLGDGPEGQADYYGITVESRRILFVIDVSGSMEDPGGGPDGATKLSDAVRELLRCVGRLDPAASFTVFAFDETVRKWRPSLVRTDAAARDGITRWAKGLRASSWTNTYAALEEALKASAADPRNDMGADYAQAADTIFLLTDGAPTTPGGRLRDDRGTPEYLRVLEGVRQWNREKRVAIHAIGVGPDINTEFLSTLARENGGTFVKAR